MIVMRKFAQCFLIADWRTRNDGFNYIWYSCIVLQVKLSQSRAKLLFPCSHSSQSQVQINLQNFRDEIRHKDEVKFMCNLLLMLCAAHYALRHQQHKDSSDVLYPAWTKPGFSERRKRFIVGTIKKCIFNGWKKVEQNTKRCYWLEFTPWSRKLNYE